MKKRLIIQIQLLQLVLCFGPITRGQSTAEAAWINSTPALSRPGKIGTLAMRIVDSGRDDPFLGDGSERELMIRFWYPAAASAPCTQADYSSRDVWAYLSRLSGFPLPSVKTNSCAEAPVATGVHPVIVFTHGYTGMFTDCTFLFEDLASRGYVVASVAHTYETTAVEFPDGGLITSRFGSYLAEASLRDDEQSLRFARTVRLADLKFVLDALQRESVSGRWFAHKLDMSRVGIMGHSLGGEVALASLQRDSRWRAAVLLDAPIAEEDTGGTARPLLLVHAGRQSWSEEECSLWSHLRGPHQAANLRDADHFTPTDAVWLFPSENGSGRGRSGETVTLLRNLVVGFFDAHLRGGLANPAPVVSLSKSQDALVTTQGQALCPSHTAVATGGLR